MRVLRAAIQDVDYLPPIELPDVGLPSLATRLVEARARGLREATVDLSLDLRDTALEARAICASLVVRARYAFGGLVHEKPASAIHVLGGSGEAASELLAAHLEAAHSLAADLELLRAGGVKGRALHDRTLLGLVVNERADYRDAPTLEERLRALLEGWRCPWVAPELDDLQLLARVRDTVCAGRST